MQKLRMPSKVIFYTFMGRALQFYGDIFCDYALMQESHHRMMMANFFWKIENLRYKYQWRLQSVGC